MIVNADDFGFTKDVNAGIVEAHRKGILTATTLMAESPAFEDGVRLARENPSLDVGCHLVLVGMPGYPATIAQLVQALALRRIHAYDRFKRQVARILEAGVTLSHLDTHKHTHLLPPVLDAVARVGVEFGIGWVRQPPLGLMRPYFRRVLSRRGLRATDHFAGFGVTGKFNSAVLSSIIHALKEGTTEFMCHPGYCTPELQQATTRLKESRQIELDALTDPRVRDAIEQNSVVLASYRDLD